jgi:uncharacterized protein (TIGR02246 family)
MRTLTVVCVLVVSALVISCTGPDPAAVRSQIEAINTEMEKDMVAGKMDTTLARYDDDCISLPNNGPRLKGKEEIKKYYMGMMGTGMKFTHADFSIVDVKVDRMYAIEVGDYALTMEMPGLPAMEDKGKYVTVWERQSDGTWKIKIETWNTNRPMMPEPGSMPAGEAKPMGG